MTTATQLDLTQENLQKETRIFPSSDKFNAYLHSHPILIQFFTKELFRLDALLETTERVLHPSAKLLEALTGSTRAGKVPLPWNLKQGILYQMQKCAIHFSEEKDSFQSLLRKTIAQAESMDKINDPPWEELRQSLYLCLNQAKQIAKEGIEQGGLNENVLLFLLRYRTPLENLYSPNFLVEISNRLFPSENSLEELYSYLSKRYTERGFERFLPFIREALINT